MKLLRAYEHVFTDRIADVVKIEPPFEHFKQWIDKDSILNLENIIQ